MKVTCRLSLQDQAAAYQLELWNKIKATTYGFLKKRRQDGVQLLFYHYAVPSNYVRCTFEISARAPGHLLFWDSCDIRDPLDAQKAVC